MKTFKFLLPILAIVLFTMCDEESLNVEPQKPKYNVEDSDDPLQKLKHEFYKNYNVLVIDNADSTDYKYTLTSNPIKAKVVNIQKKEKKIEVLNQLKEGFLSKYSAGFLKSNFPLKLIICDTLRVWGKKPSPPPGPGGPGDPEDNNEPVWYDKTVRVEKNFIMLSTNEGVYKVDDKNNVALMISDEYGSKYPTSFTKSLMPAIIFDNLCESRYGEKWHDKFIGIYGKYKNDLRWNVVSKMFDPSLEIKFMNENNPFQHKPRILLSEWPGGKTGGRITMENATPEFMDYLYDLGYPSFTRAQYFPPQKDFFGDIVEQEWARLKLSTEDLMLQWLLFSAKYTGEEREQLFNKHPELEKNFNITKDLYKKLLDIDL